MTFDPPPGHGGPPGLPPPEGDAPAWWEDDGGWGDEDGWGPFPRRRRSRVLRVVGLGVAVALLVGSVGTTLEVVLRGSSTVALPATVTGATSQGATGASSEPGTSTAELRVTFRVTNTGSGAVVPVCVLTVVRGGKVLGRYAVTEGAIPGHAIASEQASLPVSGPADARVACQS